MAIKNLPRSNTLVKKSNALCRAIWSPEAIWEARLVALVASMIRAEDEDFRSYILKISDIFPDNVGGNAYDRIDRTTDIAMSRVIKIKTPEGGIAKYNIFSKCEISPTRKTIIAEIHPDLKPHYLQLKDRFTKYSLEEFLKLPSTYSQRIYEILRSWSDQPDVLINIEDLHQMLDVPESLMKDFRNFRRRVLEKAHKDIHQHTSLKFEWEPVSKGRKVVAVRFVFSPRRQQDVEKKQRTQNSQRNNRLFLTVVKCKNNHPNGCERNNKTNVCSLCDDLLSE